MAPLHNWLFIQVDNTSGNTLVYFYPHRKHFINNIVSLEVERHERDGESDRKRKGERERVKEDDKN
jgi:hypothetical protein